MKNARVGFLIVALVAAFCMVLSARQLSHTRHSSGVFTSTDGSFWFNYSRALVLCQKDPKQRNRWLPDDSCNAYSSVCSNVSGDSSGTVACVAYPASEMKGTNFGAAAFSVNELKKIVTESECTKVQEPPPHVGRPSNETMNGVTFEVVETDGVGLGHLMQGPVYRTFHDGKCYELDITIASTNIANYDPGMVKTFNTEKVRRTLKAVLASFRFLK